MACANIYVQIFSLLVLCLQLAVANFQLETVQVLFRHGDRTPTAQELYPKLPPNPLYAKYGLGQLTEAGRLRAHRLGKMLRQRYDKFLGKAEHGDVYAISSDMDRTKMTLQLVLKGLYPLTNASWEQNHWSPVPTLYLPIPLDSVLFSWACQGPMEDLRRVKNSTAIQQKLSKYSELIDYLAHETGLSMNDPIANITSLYQLLDSQHSMNITSPQWATDDVRKGIEQIAELAFEVQSFTTQQKRLGGGVIVKRFIQNMQPKPHVNAPKIYLYSAHDINVAAFAKAHGFTEPKIPNYCSTFIVETLRNSLGNRYVQIYFWNGTAEKLIFQKIHKCLTYCPLKTYQKRMQDVIPTDEESKCLWNNMTINRLQQYYKASDY